MSYSLEQEMWFNSELKAILWVEERTQIARVDVCIFCMQESGFAPWHCQVPKTCLESTPDPTPRAKGCGPKVNPKTLLH